MVIGFIPDGNRRWAVQQRLPRHQGYAQGIAPGLALFEACRALGVEEVSVYGFTQDNTRRPTEQAKSFRAACVAFALEVWRRGAAWLALPKAGQSALERIEAGHPSTAGGVRHCTDDAVGRVQDPD